MAFSPIRQPGPMASGGKETPVDQNMFARVRAGVMGLFSRDPARPAASPATPQDMAAGMLAAPGTMTPGRPVWMGPGTPLTPIVRDRSDVAGREYDYPVGYNIGASRRETFEGPSFEELEALAENSDMVALAIATREDQMSKLRWSCLPRQQGGRAMRGKPDDRARKIDDFFRRPDGRQPFASWMRSLVHEQLVYDAPALYVHRTVGGDVYRLEPMRGKTLRPLIDVTGRTPDPPEAAFQQVLKGVPAINYTTDEIVYWPRNRRVGRRYGYSPVQQIITTINVAMRREMVKLAYFTEGNVPEALCAVPDTWTPDQIERWQTVWDAMLRDQNARRRMKFVPGGFQFQPTRVETALADPLDEWLMRVVCYAFSLSPAPFVRMMNRATAQTSYEAAISEGLQPMMGWAKDMLDHVIQKVFGYDDLECVWDAISDVDPIEEDASILAQIQVGRVSVDEWRIKRGEDPIGMKHAVWGIGPMGIMFVEDLLKAQKAGLMMPQAPMPMDAGMMGHGGMPPGMGHTGMPGAMPGPMPMGAKAPAGGSLEEALAGIPSHVLDAVGLGADGHSARRIDVTARDSHDSDPLAPNVTHPNVLATLREAERRQGRSGR